MAEQEAPAQGVKTVVLPASKAALAWDRATDRLVEEAEIAEREAEATYRQAREKYEAAKRHAHYMRQFRQLARVEFSTAPPVQNGQSSATSASGKPWARQHDACIICGGTESKHASKGRCARCNDYRIKHGGVDRVVSGQGEGSDG